MAAGREWQGGGWGREEGRRSEEWAQGEGSAPGDPGRKEADPPCSGRGLVAEKHSAFAGVPGDPWVRVGGERRRRQQGGGGKGQRAGRPPPSGS